jgi:hypothetical protein
LHILQKSPNQASKSCSLRRSFPSIPGSSKSAPHVDPRCCSDPLRVRACDSFPVALASVFEGRLCGFTDSLTHKPELILPDLISTKKCHDCSPR